MITVLPPPPLTDISLPQSISDMSLCVTLYTGHSPLSVRSLTDSLSSLRPAPDPPAPVRGGVTVTALVNFLLRTENLNDRET